MDIVDTLRTFTRVVETGSLTAVAREKNTSQSKISRQITQLEEHFGLRLLHRTTRHLSLTDDGQSLRDHAKNLLEVVQAMEASLGRHKSSPAGQVRLATPVSLGLWLIARLPALTARYPDLFVELVMEERYGDMIEERLDLAVRSGEMTNPSLVTRRLGMLPRIAVAAPAYLERRGSPCLHEDLMNHDCIVRRTPESDSKWRLTDEDGSVDVAVRGAVSTNSHEVARNAALRGLGIALLPEYTVVDDIKSGRLRRVLRRYTSEKLPIYVVYPSRRHLAPRTRAVIDFLIEEVGRLHSHRIDRDWPAITQENDPGARDQEIVALVA